MSASPTLEDQMIAIVAEALDIEADEVTSASRIVSDLGADSIDILDINYRVSKQFGVNLPLVDLKKKFEESNVVWLDDDGNVTEDGLREALQLLPELDDGRIKVGEGIQAIYTVLFVSDLISMLERSLAQEAA